MAADDSQPADGTVVDGTTVAYQAIAPFSLSLGTYYDPQSLAPVEAHGNQVIFVNFKDPAAAGSPVTYSTAAAHGFLVFDEVEDEDAEQVYRSRENDADRPKLIVRFRQ